MCIGITTIKNIMKNVTDREISNDAAYLLREKIIVFIEQKTKDTEQLLLRRNKERKQQSIGEKKRISSELMNEVLK